MPRDGASSESEKSASLARASALARKEKKKQAFLADTAAASKLADRVEPSCSASARPEDDLVPELALSAPRLALVRRTLVEGSPLDLDLQLRNLTRARSSPPDGGVCAGAGSVPANAVVR